MKSLTQADIWNIALRGAVIVGGLLALLAGYLYFGDVHFLQALAVSGFFVLVYVVCGFYDLVRR